MKVCRGFTLLELMVAIAVLAILATVGVPSFRDLIQNNRVTTQTNELVTALNFARAEAVKRGRTVRVTVTQAAPGWTATVFLDPAGDNETLRVVNRQGSIVSLDADGEVYFLGTGVPVAVATFNLEPGPSCTGQKRRQIAIAPSGQATTTREACGG
ncbi:MAG: GspH/FimT family pseudopilin [Gammaproteobacteria bacterium]